MTVLKPRSECNLKHQTVLKTLNPLKGRECQLVTLGHPVLTYIFTARRYASAVLAVIVCLSVCPSVCLSVRHKSKLYKNG